MLNAEKKERRGFTMVELVIVMIILAILAGLVVPLIGGFGQISTPGGPKSGRQIGTETTLSNIRDTFVSTGTTTGLWADMGHIPNRLPRTIGQMFLSTPPLAGTPLFDPVTKIGWRGPYLKQATGLYPDITDIHRMTGNTWSADNFTANYGNEDDPILVDAWGNPIVLQIDFDSDGTITTNEARAARLVSAGPDGVIDLELDDINDTQAQYLIDDVVIYLRIVE